MPNIQDLEGGSPTYRASSPRPIDTARIFVRVGGYLRFDRELVSVRGFRLILSINQALVLKRFLAKPNTCISYAELFANVSARDHWGLIWKLKKKLVKALPEADIRNFIGLGYALILPDAEIGSLPQRKVRKPRWENVMIQGQSVAFSPNAAMALKRLMMAGPGVPILKEELFAEVQSKYHVLRELRTKLRAVPGVEVRTGGRSYSLFLKCDEGKKENPRIQELKKKLERISLSRPYLAEIRTCLLKANGEGVRSRQFPGGHAAGTVIKGFRDLRDQVVRGDPAFGPCFVSHRGQRGYMIDLRRYGKLEDPSE